MHSDPERNLLEHKKISAPSVAYTLTINLNPELFTLADIVWNQA